MNSSASETALKRCDEHIAWYASSGRWMRWFHYGSQVAVVVLTASVPLLALLAAEPMIKGATGGAALLVQSSVPQACLAGLAAVLVSMANLFQWHKKWLARAFTCEVLKSERIKFQTGAGEPYASAKNEEDGIRRFVPATGTAIGLLLNFGAERLEFKRKTRTYRPKALRKILSCKSRYPVFRTRDRMERMRKMPQTSAERFLSRQSCHPVFTPSTDVGSHGFKRISNIELSTINFQGR